MTRIKVMYWPSEFEFVSIKDDNAAHISVF